MTRSQARLLGVGLGSLLFPACYGWQQPFVNEPPQTVVNAPATTVKRIASETAPPAGQYVQVPTYQRIIQYDQYGRPFERIGVDFNRPIVASPMPVPQPPAQGSPAPAIVEPMEVVAVTHTNEPPLAGLESVIQPVASRQISEKTPAPPAPKPTNVVTTQSTPIDNSLPTVVPPGSQILVLQHSPPPTNAISESVTNLLTPPVPAEELKLVSVPKLQPANSPVMNALKAYQDKAPAEAEKLLSHLDPGNQQLLKRLLPLAVKLGEAGLPTTDPSEVAELIDQLQNVVTALRAKAALRIDKLSYCRAPVKPMRTGTYQPLPDDHVFRPGETVELYMELRNFSCEAKEAEYSTHVTTLIEIRDDRGEVLAKYEFERDRPDVGQAPRQEYFHICRFPVQGLSAGQYTLTAQVTDVPSGKSAKRSLPLRIEATRRLARGSAD